MDIVYKTILFCVAVAIGFYVGQLYQIVVMPKQGEIIMKQVEPKTLKQGDLILDVRTPAEQAEKSLALSHWRTPVDELNPKQFIKEYRLDGKKTLNIVCKQGVAQRLPPKNLKRPVLKMWLW